MTMEVTINGEIHTFDKPVTVQELIAYLGIGKQRFAIEINQTLVPRSSFDSHQLKAGDQIEVVGAIGGG